jgi:hypothetical protein
VTIPIQPGPWSFLDNIARGAGEHLRNREELRRYEQNSAQQNTQLLGTLIQLGILDPSVIAPQIGTTLEQAGITPFNPNAAVIPSEQAAGARQRAPIIAGADPATTRGQMLLKLPTEADVAKSSTEANVANAAYDATLDPSVARVVGGTPTSDVARNIESANSAASAEPQYVSAAERFVMDQRGDAKRAYQAAAKDPQYAELVKSGQLSEEYFGAAAKKYQLLDDEGRRAWSQLNRLRDQQAKEERLYYESQIRGYENNIKQKAARLKTITPKPGELNIWLGSAQEKLAKGETLVAQEQQAIALEQERMQLQAEIQADEGTLDELRVSFQRAREPNFAPGADQPKKLRGKQDFSGVRSGTSSSAGSKPTAQAGGVNIIQVIADLKSGKLTPEQIRASKLITDEQKQRILGGRK